MMNQGGAELLVKFVEFTVRNDKDQGLLIEKFATENNEYFFKKHQQAVSKHCHQIQHIVRSAGVQRTKKLRIDIAPFDYEYYRGNIATFKGCSLDSVNKQIEKSINRFVDKDIGAMKRAATIEQNKQRKIDDKNNKIINKMKEAEKKFQQLRAKRIAELFGPAGHPQGGSSQGGSSQGGSSQGVSSQGVSSQGGSLQDGSSQGGSSQGGSLQDGSSQGGTSQGGTSQDFRSTPANHTPRIVPTAIIPPQDHTQAESDDDAPMNPVDRTHSDSDF